MAENSYTPRNVHAARASCILFALLLSLFLVSQAVCQSESQGQPKVKKAPSPKADLKLEGLPFKIAYETYRATDGKESWELYLMDGFWIWRHSVSMCR